MQPMPTNQKGRDSAEFARRGASWHLRGCGSLRSRTCSKPGLLSCKMRLEGARSEVRVRDASSRPAAPARERPSATFGRRASSAEAPPRAPMAEPWLWPLRPSAFRFGFEESRFPWRRPSASTSARSGREMSGVSGASGDTAFFHLQEVLLDEQRARASAVGTLGSLWADRLSGCAPTHTGLVRKPQNFEAFNLSYVGALTASNSSSKLQPRPSSNGSLRLRV